MRNNPAKSFPLMLAPVISFCFRIPIPPAIVTTYPRQKPLLAPHCTASHLVPRINQHTVHTQQPTQHVSQRPDPATARWLRPPHRHRPCAVEPVGHRAPRRRGQGAAPSQRRQGGQHCGAVLSWSMGTSLCCPAVCHCLSYFEKEGVYFMFSVMGMYHSAQWGTQG